MVVIGGDRLDGRKQTVWNGKKQTFLFRKIGQKDGQDDKQTGLRRNARLEFYFFQISARSFLVLDSVTISRKDRRGKEMANSRREG